MSLRGQQRWNYVIDDSYDSTNVLVLPKGLSVYNESDRNYYILSEYALRFFVIRSRQYRLCDSMYISLENEYNNLKKKLEKNDFPKGVIVGSVGSIIFLALLKIIIG